MFSWRKRKSKVELGELEDDRESLPSFLRVKLKAEVTSEGNNVLVDSEKLSPQELKSLVSKFIYHEHLNNKYWVALEGDIVRIHKFKEVKESGKRRKETIPPSTIKHGW